MTITQLKETPLSNWHQAHGARMVDFAGWSMPVLYKSIIAEHMAVRTKVGIFDVSHMGEFIVKGIGAKDFLQYMIANDLNKLAAVNHALYTQFVTEEGGTVDDLILYRRQSDYLLVVNASNMEKDWRWLQQYINRFNNVELENISEKTALIALQGPMAIKLMNVVAPTLIADLSFFGYREGLVCGINIGIGRTGYTGEDGCEIFVNSKDVEVLWNLLMEKGHEFGIEPCGLGARDTLRLEAGLPLYGHELDESTSPLEAGLGWSVKLDKGDFLGRQALLAQKEQGLAKTCVCLQTEGKALPRCGYPVLNSDGTKIGVITSGTQGIFVGYPIAMAYVKPQYATVGGALLVEIRGQAIPAKVVKRPFYNRSKASSGR